jgi:hypothetical protein
MALSDSCFEFLQAVSNASKQLAEEAHRYSAPDYPIPYGPEIDALRRAAAVVAEHPYDHLSGGRLLKLATTVVTYLDTPPDSPRFDLHEDRVRELVRLMQQELTGEDARAVEGVVENIVTETRFTGRAVARLRGMMPKLGKASYEIVVKIIGDIGSAAAKKMLGM